MSIYTHIYSIYSGIFCIFQIHLFSGCKDIYFFQDMYIFKIYIIFNYIYIYLHLENIYIWDIQNI